MSSAAKLRKYGRGTATVAAAALVMTSFGPAAFASWDVNSASQTGTVGSTTAGTIGILDTDDPVTRTDNNNGARLLHAGQDNQAIADVRVVIPNRFRAGDKIKLRLLDRSATEETDGNTNSGPSTKLAFSAAPSVSISEALKANTVVALNTEDPAAANTETEPVNAWTAPSPLTSTSADVKPGVTPAFKVSTAASNGAAGFEDTVVLEVTSDASTGDPNGTWALTLSGLKVNVGAKATPGEVRLVPFASNSGTKETSSPWFHGNAEKDTKGTPETTDDIQREISIYTVPAYIAPVTLAMANGNISADGNPQNVGDVTITETQAFSLETGTYDLTFDGAQIANADTKNIKLSVANGGTNETVGGAQIVGSNTLRFSLSNGDAAKTSTITVSGLMLRSTAQGTIKLALTGGSVGKWYAQAGEAPAVAGLKDSEAFIAETGTSAFNYVVAENSTTSALENAAGASLSRDVATQFKPGTYLVTASADLRTYNFTDGTDATNVDGASITAAAARLLGGAGVYKVAAVAQKMAISLDTDATTAGGAASLPQAVLDLVGAGITSDGGKSTAGVAQTGADVDFVITGGDTYRITGATLPLAASTRAYLTTDSTKFITLPAGLDAGTVAVVGDETTAAGSTLTTPSGEVWEGGPLPSINGASVTFTAPDDTTTVAISSGAGAAWSTGEFSLALASGTAPQWTVPLTAAGETGTVSYTSTDRKVFTKPGGNTDAKYPATVTFGSPLAHPLTSADDVDGGGPLAAGTANFTIAAGVPEAAPYIYGVNQGDIVAPLARMIDVGVATAESNRIGGNNRYETAAKVARQAFDGSQNVIIASGENFPDALSSSYLSQRMNAPVLLVGRNWIPDDTLAALRDLTTQRVYIVGGEAAISADVQKKLADLPTYTKNANESRPTATGSKMGVLRIAGGTRYTTNQLVNYYAAAWGDFNSIGKTVYKTGEAGKHTAIFARGDNFPDALAAGVLTAGVANADGSHSRANALPLILTDPGSLNESARDQIARLDVEHGLMVGGTAALSDGVKTSLEGLNVSTHRISGTSADADDRYWTASAVSEFAMRPSAAGVNNEYPGLGFIGAPVNGEFTDDVTSFLADGLKFPDALTAAPWIGRTSNVINLVQPKDLTAASRDFLSKRAADVEKAIALGLGDAVSTGVLNEANKLASAK